MSKSLRGAEIFAAGKFYPGNMDGQSIDFTESDLDHIVAAFDERASAGRVPLKLGHNEQQPMTDGAPALGWVSRVWREGSKLLADFTDMPAAVYDAIKAGLYKFISVELSKDVKTSGGLRSWALDAVALLGADIPAVGTLKDLQALTLSARGGLRPAAVFALTRATMSTGARSTMTDQEIAELKARLSAAEAETVRIKAASDAREAELQKEKVARHREAITAQFTAAVNAERILPAVMNRFLGSRYFKDDAEVLKFGATEIEQDIKDNEQPKKKGPKGSGSGGGGQAKMSDEISDRVKGLKPDSQIVELTEDYAAEHNLDLSDSVQYDRAVKAVFRKFPDLAKSYIFQPGTDRDPSPAGV